MKLAEIAKSLNGNFKLYKYQSQQYGRKMVEEGEIMIGTIKEFRNTEQHGSEIGDKNEGIRNVKVDANSIVVPPPVYGPNNSIEADNKYINSTNSPIVYDLGVHNLYILCTTHTPSRKAMERMEKEVCVEIHDVPLFFDSITIELARRGLIDYKAGYDSGYVKYPEFFLGPDGIMVPIKQDVSVPWLHKGSSYRYQQEARAAWTPLVENAESKVVRSDGIIKACRMIQI
ncbi:hypothetical protein [Larkinella arboricola]